MTPISSTLMSGCNGDTMTRQTAVSPTEGDVGTATVWPHCHAYSKVCPFSVESVIGVVQTIIISGVIVRYCYVLRL